MQTHRKKSTRNEGLEAKFQLDPYQQILTVMFCDNLVGAANYYGVDSEGLEDKGGFTSSTDEGPLICLPRTNTTCGIVSHEATHAAYRVFCDIGEDIAAAEEAFAYLQQYIFECIVEHAKCSKIKLK